jgi:glycosyltransferase involved in cell wall biosynthesis
VRSDEQVPCSAGGTRDGMGRLVKASPDRGDRNTEDTISVVVPSFNQVRFLGEALDSIGAQGESLEIIVVDGGSTDGSVDLIRGRVDVTRWTSGTDGGQSEALNKGFRDATGTWLSWLNSDDLLLPGAIERFRRELSAVPNGRWFAGGGWMVDEVGRGLREYPAPSGSLRAEDLVPWTDNWFGQPGTFFRRDLFEEAGGHVRVDLRYAMDLDLWLRMGKIDCLRPIPEAVGAYRLHTESKTVSERRQMEVEVIRVLLEEMGPDAALKRVDHLARERFDLEARWNRLTDDLRSPNGWMRILSRRVKAGRAGRGQRNS